MVVSNVRRNMVITFIAVFVFAPLLWNVLDRDPPYTFQKVEIEPNQVERGTDAYVTFTVNPVRRVACGPGLIYRQFKEVASSKLHTFDPVLRVREPEIIDNKFTRIARIPDSVSPGVTIYNGWACYTCNPVQSWLRWPVCVATPPITFNVLDHPK